MPLVLDDFAYGETKTIIEHRDCQPGIAAFGPAQSKWHLIEAQK
jgi:hypothetical protein